MVSGKENQARKKPRITEPVMTAHMVNDDISDIYSC
jgi:hypothetical protein